MEKSQIINHGVEDNSNYKKELDDSVSPIDFFKINPNINSKFRTKLESQTIKISAIEAVSHPRRRKSLSEFSLELDDNSEEDEVNNEDSSNRFEFLLRLFINLGYSICLIPFRLVPVTIGHKKHYEIRHHILQRVKQITIFRNHDLEFYFVLGHKYVSMLHGIHRLFFCGVCTNWRKKY